MFGAGDVHVAMIHQVELVLGLLMVVAALVTLSSRFNLPYPILLVVGGLLLGFIPGLPRIQLAPDLIFLIFLPPLLYRDALTTSWRDFRADIRKISLLAVGLVLATTLGVGIVAHAVVPHLPWSVAFVLGAIVAPTDAVAASAVADGMSLPPRLLAILEGESLVNDATALVAYRFAVAAVATGTFSLFEAGGRLVLVTLGGVAVGLTVGWVVGQVRRYLNDPAVENLISLLTGFAAYLPAEQLGVSGVIAAVSAGIYLGRVSPRFASPQTRVQSTAMWEMTTFILNGLIFILIGLQLRGILAGTSDLSILSLLCYAAVVSLTVVTMRFVWLFGYGFVPRLLFPQRYEDQPRPRWQYAAVLGWGGIRGVVSLAAALALPAATNAGGAFPSRSLVIFLTFSVLLVTLLGQGLTFPYLIRVLGVTADGRAEREEAKARLKAARAGMARLDQLAGEDWVRADAAESLRTRYQEQADHFRAHYEGVDLDSEEEQVEANRRLRRELLDAERGAVLRLRDEGYIADDILRRVQHDLDLASLRLDVQHRGRAAPTYDRLR
jgi:CPA1 family monovalent cation:H+ antiporter